MNKLPTVPAWADRGGFQPETVAAVNEIDALHARNSNANPPKITPRAEIATIIEKHRMRHVPMSWRRNGFEEMKQIERNDAERHHGRFQSWHQIYAVMLEELEELWEQIRLKPNKRDNTLILVELVQLAAMCESAAYHMQLIAETPDELVAHADRPRIVCLCGSSRFVDAFHDANEAETLAGRIVLSIGVVATGALDAATSVKRDLDQLHKRKLDMADEVLVLNVGGYVGDSTADEMLYAFKLGKPLRMLERRLTPDSKERIDAAVRRHLNLDA